jgi:hypothetical protein
LICFPHSWLIVSILRNIYSKSHITEPSTPEYIIEDWVTYRRSRLYSFKAMENRGSKIRWIKDNICSTIVMPLLWSLYKVQKQRVNTTLSS